MLEDAFELGETLNNKKIQYKLHQPMWYEHDLSILNLDLGNWNTIKYLNEDGDGFHPDINQVPDNAGGLYLFSIKCPIIPGLTDFPVYLGRAQCTDNQNLRKRCKEYYNRWYRNDERPKITKMISYWGPDLYLSFIEIEDNEDTIDYEKKLINSLLLPFNDRIPDRKIQQAINAF